MVAATLARRRCGVLTPLQGPGQAEVGE
jgi:hypothetical protein